MKRMFNRINEAGTMLVEAMAMLGLIAMVTPILYKKAAERTTELQDINASNQLRILANAMDSYIKDNFTRINDGETVVNSCNVGSMVYRRDFGQFRHFPPLRISALRFPERRQDAGQQAVFQREPLFPGGFA